MVSVIYLWKCGICVWCGHMCLWVCLRPEDFGCPCLSLPYSLVLCSLTEPEDGLAASKYIPGSLLSLPFHRAEVTDSHSHICAQLSTQVLGSEFRSLCSTHSCPLRHLSHPSCPIHFKAQLHSRIVYNVKIWPFVYSTLVRKLNHSHQVVIYLKIIHSLNVAQWWQ